MTYRDSCWCRYMLILNYIFMWTMASEHTWIIKTICINNTRMSVAIIIKWKHIFTRYWDYSFKSEPMGFLTTEFNFTKLNFYSSVLCSACSSCEELWKNILHFFVRQWHLAYFWCEWTIFTSFHFTQKWWKKCLNCMAQFDCYSTIVQTSVFFSDRHIFKKHQQQEHTFLNLCE